MLAQFNVTRTFNAIRVSLWVSCEAKQASLTITEKRVIRATGDIPFAEVRTPEKAEAWLSRPVMVYGKTAADSGTMAYIEDLDRQQRLGLAPFGARQ